MNGGADMVPVTNGEWFCGCDMMLGPVMVLFVGVACMYMGNSFTDGAIGVVCCRSLAVWADGGKEL